MKDQEIEKWQLENELYKLFEDFKLCSELNNSFSLNRRKLRSHVEGVYTSNCFAQNLINSFNLRNFKNTFWYITDGKTTPVIVSSTLYYIFISVVCKHFLKHRRSIRTI